VVGGGAFVSRRTTYLLHFIDPETGQPARYQHAGHYIGDTEKGREDGRLEEHREGRGAVLTAAARRAGLDFVITRTWPGGASKARQLKTRSGALYCPECSEHPEPGTRPRRPGAKYLTRRQREAARRAREVRQQGREAAAAPGAEAQSLGWCWPGKPEAACPGCESRGRAAHTKQCDERERAVARFLADIGAEPRKETGMAEPQGPLTGPELDEEIGLLALQYPEYAPGEFVPWGDRLSPADGRRAAELKSAQHQAEADTLAAEPGDECGCRDHEAPDHLYGSPECTKADPETAHFGWSQPEPDDAGRFPLPRVLDAREASPALAPVAASLPDGTPHADPYLAGRGWQARGGLYIRRAQAQLEAG
jgi:hypothetical protein